VDRKCAGREAVIAPAMEPPVRGQHMRWRDRHSAGFLQDSLRRRTCQL